MTEKNYGLHSAKVWRASLALSLLTIFILLPWWLFPIFNLFNSTFGIRNLDLQNRFAVVRDSSGDYRDGGMAWDISKTFQIHVDENLHPYLDQTKILIIHYLKSSTSSRTEILRAPGALVGLTPISESNIYIARTDGQNFLISHYLKGSTTLEYTISGSSTDAFVRKYTELTGEAPQVRSKPYYEGLALDEASTTILTVHNQGHYVGVCYRDGENQGLSVLPLLPYICLSYDQHSLEYFDHGSTRTLFSYNELAFPISRRRLELLGVSSDKKLAILRVNSKFFPSIHTYADRIAATYAVEVATGKSSLLTDRSSDEVLYLH